MTSCWQLIPTCDTPTLQSLLSSAPINGDHNRNSKGVANHVNHANHVNSGKVCGNQELIRARINGAKLRDRCATKDEMIAVLESIRDKLEYRCQQLMDMCECKNYALVEFSQHVEEVNDLYAQYARLKLKNNGDIFEANAGNYSGVGVGVSSPNKCAKTASNTGHQSSVSPVEERRHENLPILKSMLTSKFRDTIAPELHNSSGPLANSAPVVNNLYEPSLDESRPHKCFWPECRFSTRDRKTLRTHERIHTNEKPYKCIWPNCAYATGDPSNYRKHRRRHNNSIKMVCDVAGCNFMALRADSMLKHRAMHIRNRSTAYPTKRWHFEKLLVKDNRERLIVCRFPNCGKRFLNDAGLAGHQITHRNHNIVNNNNIDNSDINVAVNKPTKEESDDDVIVLNF